MNIFSNTFPPSAEAMNPLPPAPRLPCTLFASFVAFCSNSPGPHSSPRRSGFTLLEILVAVMIITILATVVGVQIAKEPGRARIAKTKATLSTLQTALQLYRMDNGNYPTQQQGLTALCVRSEVPPVPRKFREHGYLDKPQAPRDGWDSEFVYMMPGPNGEPFLIISYGADTEPGGDEENADITSNDL